ncbi:MAG: hypothetical protein Tsb005_01820 [Gammaproteobacteria bacterium]
MKVLCRKIFSPMGKDLGDSSPWLKVGNEYVVLAMEITEGSGILIYIQTEQNNEPAFFDLSGFQIINQHMPSSWVTVINDIDAKKSMVMLPAIWNYAGFFEQILNEEAEAIDKFNEAAEEIHLEEQTV